MAQLLTSIYMPTDTATILETKDDVIGSGTAAVKILRVTGIFQKADTVNQNGRIYPKYILKEAVNKLQKSIAARKVRGELDHPTSTKVNLDRVSHLITKLWMDGIDVYGEAEIIEETTQGKNAAAIIRRKSPLGISSRGAGEVKVVGHKEGQEISEVLEDFQLVTFDLVDDPSVAEAEMHVMEGRNRKSQLIMTRQSLRQLDPKKCLVKELEKYLQRND